MTKGLAIADGFALPREYVDVDVGLVRASTILFG